MRKTLLSLLAILLFSQFAIAQNSIVSFSPTSARVGETITITMASPIVNTNNVKVIIGGKTYQNLQTLPPLEEITLSPDKTKLTVTVRANIVGANQIISNLDVTVKDGSISYTKSGFEYIYSAPTITSIPSLPAPSMRSNIIINGTDFFAEPVSVYFGGVKQFIYSSSITNSTLQVLVGHVNGVPVNGIVTAPLVVTTSMGSVEIPFEWTYPTPVITSFDPVTARQGDELKIYGNFLFNPSYSNGFGTNIVSPAEYPDYFFNPINVTIGNTEIPVGSYSIVSMDRFGTPISNPHLLIPNLPLVSGDEIIRVTTRYGTAESATALDFDENPHIVDFNPKSATKDQYVAIELSSPLVFNNIDHSISVRIGSNTVASNNFGEFSLSPDKKTLTVKVGPTAASGDIVVTNNLIAYQKKSGFEYIYSAPTVATNISNPYPSISNMGTHAVVNGTDFLSGDLNVTFGGVNQYIQSTTNTSFPTTNTQLQLVIGHVTGVPDGNGIVTAPLRITTNNGSVEIPYKWTYPSPVINNFLPASAKVGDEVRIYGQNLANWNYNGSPSNPITPAAYPDYFYEPTSVHIGSYLIPSSSYTVIRSAENGYIPYIKISNLPVVEDGPVTITTKYGTATSTVNFDFIEPVITISGVSVTQVGQCPTPTPGSIVVNAAITSGSMEYGIINNRAPQNGYNWQTSNTFSNLSGGSYSIRVRDASNHPYYVDYNSPVVITVDLVLTEILAPSQIICAQTAFVPMVRINNLKGRVDLSLWNGAGPEVRMKLDGNIISAGTNYTVIDDCQTLDISLPSVALSAGQHELTFFLQYANNWYMDENSSNDTMSMIITVHPIPDVNRPADITVYSGDLVPSIVFSGTYSTTTYNWVNSIPIIGLPASGVGNIPDFVAVNLAGVDMNASVSVTPTNIQAGCTGQQQLFHINVKPSPRIVDFNPKTAHNGEVVTITGINLNTVTSVRFGNVDALSFNIVNQNTITAIVGEGASGTVQVVNSEGRNASMEGFNYNYTPIINAVTPNTFTFGQTVTVSGKYLNYGNVFGNIIQIGDSVPVIQKLSDNEIIFVVGGANSNTLKVTNGYGSFETTVDHSNPVPSITSFTTTAKQGDVVDIYGINFAFQKNVPYNWLPIRILIGGVEIPATQYQVISSTHIRIPSLPFVGTGLVKVITMWGTANAGTFTFDKKATITSFSPVSAGYKETVTIKGIAFRSVSAVSFGGVPALSFVRVDDTTITAVVGNGASGKVKIVANGGLPAESTQLFEFIDGISMNKFNGGNSNSVQINPTVSVKTESEITFNKFSEAYSNSIQINPTVGSKTESRKLVLPKNTHYKSNLTVWVEILNAGGVQLYNAKHHIDNFNNNNFVLPFSIASGKQLVSGIYKAIVRIPNKTNTGYDVYVKQFVVQ